MGQHVKINSRNIAARRGGNGLLHRMVVASLAVGLISSSLSAVTLMADSAPASAVPCVAETADVRQALEMAVSCGSEVEALSERTEYAQVKINKLGQATLVSYSEPQRVHHQDGSWSNVDRTLRVTAADGSLAPVATLANVRFSGGGNGPMVTWQENGSTFTLAWPGGALPAPRVDGDTAIYESVYPDVDLHLMSTVDGFNYVLAVKTLAAAANPALRQMRYPIGGDVKVEPTVQGGLTVRDPAGGFFAESPGAAMWDSSVNLEAAGEPGGTIVAGDPVPQVFVSDADAPGAAAASAPVAVTVAAGELVVTPDLAMLTDPKAATPIFIDPAFNKGASKWVYATSNGETNDATNARVGRQPAPTGGGELYRSYFQFDIAQMKNTNVLSAHIDMELDHSWSCGPTWVTLYRVASISAASGARIPWSGSGSRPLGSAAPKIGAFEGNAHEGSPCDQPNVTVVFDASTVRSDIDAVNTDTYTVGLCACNTLNQYESNQERWKRFETGKSKLIATYDLPPYKPVGQPFTTTADCYKQCSSPAIVRNLQPTLRMSVQDPFGGSLLTAVEIRTAASDTAPIVVDNGSFRFTVSTQAVITPGTSPAVIGQIQVPAGKLTNGSTYYWRATTADSANLWSGWGAWNSFTVDTSPPAVSSVSSTQFPSKQWVTVVNNPGTFTINGPSDVAEFTWQVDAGSVTTLIATGTTTKTATTASYTPTKDMVHILHAKAKDIAGNTGGTFDHEFWVRPLPNRCWNWRLDETAGTVAADSGNTDPLDELCAPIGSTVTAMPGTLAGGVSWVADAERGRVASFAGNGGITTGSAVLDTTKAFTVAAWVKFTNLAANDFQTAISQAGSNVSRFQLQYRKDANGGAGGFCFTMRTADVAGASSTSACAVPVSWPVTEGQWVHLAGVYEPAAATIRVFVMGDPLTCGGDAAETGFSSSWSATGKFVIGRSSNGSGGAAADWLTGSMDKVYAHQRALANSEICQLSLQ